MEIPAKGDKKTMKKRVIFLSIAFVLATGALHLFAQQQGQAGPGQVTYIFSCCGSNDVRVQLNAPPVLNGCQDGDGYITNPNDGANILYQSLLLGAYLSGNQVIVTLSGCYAGRPQINGVIACVPQFNTCFNDSRLESGSGGSAKDMSGGSDKGRSGDSGKGTYKAEQQAAKARSSPGAQE